MSEDWFDSCKPEAARKSRLKSDPTSLITQILETSYKVNDGRSKSDVMLCIMEETGELATEVAIDKKFKKRKPSADGVIGESIDLIIGAVDMIYQELKAKHGIVGPGHMEDIMREIATEKLSKWEQTCMSKD